jgi:hypothetical protein
MTRRKSVDAPPPLYCFNVSGKRFYLSWRNLWSDGPNKLTSLLVQHPNRRYFTLDTNPNVFEYVHRHLQGYHPMHDFHRQSLIDLSQDATYYSLPRLIEWCSTNEVFDETTCFGYLFSQDTDTATTTTTETSVPPSPTIPSTILSPTGSSVGSVSSHTLSDFNIDSEFECY